MGRGCCFLLTTPPLTRPQGPRSAVTDTSSCTVGTRTPTYSKSHETQSRGHSGRTGYPHARALWSQHRQGQRRDCLPTNAGGPGDGGRPGRHLGLPCGHHWMWGHSCRRTDKGAAPVLRDSRLTRGMADDTEEQCPWCLVGADGMGPGGGGGPGPRARRDPTRPTLPAAATWAEFRLLLAGNPVATSPSLG